MPSPCGLMDYRHVDLIDLMKTLDRPVLEQLWHLVLVYFYFSSLFNTIRPALLGERLTVMQVDSPV